MDLLQKEAVHFRTAENVRVGRNSEFHIFPESSIIILFSGRHYKPSKVFCNKNSTPTTKRKIFTINFVKKRAFTC